MKSIRQLILPILVTTALAAACNPFAHKNTPTAAPTQYPKDPRFSEFTFTTDGVPKVREGVEALNAHMPELGATDGHFVSANFPEGSSWLPSPDHHFWVTGVAEVPNTTITMLVDDNIGGSSLLPGIHPGLYEYVPEGCSFTAVDPAVANKVLGADPEAIYSEWGSFEIVEFALSADCNLIVVTGEGVTG